MNGTFYLMLHIFVPFLSHFFINSWNICVGTFKFYTYMHTCTYFTYRPICAITTWNVSEGSRFVTHMHLSTKDMKTNNFENVMFIFMLQPYLFSFATFMFITPEIFVLKTSNFTYICIYVLSMCTLIFWTTS